MKGRRKGEKGLVGGSKGDKEPVGRLRDGGGRRGRREGYSRRREDTEGG